MVSVVHTRTIPCFISSIHAPKFGPFVDKYSGSLVDAEHIYILFYGCCVFYGNIYACTLDSLSNLA